MNFIDFFAGIGGMRLGFEMAGHQCIGFCEYDKYAIKSYVAMHKTNGEWFRDDIRKLNSEDIPYADIWTFGFPCFERDTLVMTDKGYRKIQEIEAGDEVLTHKNRFKKVIKPMKQYAREIYELSIYGTEKFKATEEHPFYVRKKNGSILSDTMWVPVKDLDTDCYVGVPINQKSELPCWDGIEYTHHSKTKRLNNLDFRSLKLWWLIGRYFADGGYVVSKRKNRDGSYRSDGYRVVIACGKHKKEKLLEHIRGLFHYTVAEERTAYKIHILNKELAMFLMRFSKGSSRKRLTEDILNLPVHLVSAFLKGYFSGDGCKIGKYIKATTTSQELAYGLQALIHKAYKRPCALYKTKTAPTHTIEGRKVNQKTTYQIVFKENHNSWDDSFYENGYIWVKFKSKQLQRFDDFVYNMEVQDDNSYTAYNLGVHNCQDISVAGKQGGLNGKRSGLYFKVIDLVKGKEENDKPEWLVAENVKNIQSINSGFDFLSVLSEMDEAGYDVWWYLFNSKDHGVPQNRERVFFIGHLRNRGGRKILPVTRENTTALKQIIGGCQGERVYDATGLSCTLVGGSGGVGAKTGLYFIDQSTKKTEITNVSRCITSRYTGGIVNRTAQNSAVLEAYPILTPDREEKRQNGRRVKNCNEPMFTLTGADKLT